MQHSASVLAVILNPMSRSSLDPREDIPTAASLEDQALQIESAAMLSNIDADCLLNYLLKLYR